MLKETAVRWHTIEVDVSELDLEEGEELHPSEIEDYPEIREQMWESLQESGWDAEDVLEATWSEVDD
jgi:hypothetical protein